jgi:hypothetical protein
MAKSLTISQYIKSGLTFRYLSNFSIIVGILSYYMNAYDIFLVCTPLIIVNFILICIVMIFNIDELMEGVIGNIIPIQKDRDDYSDLFR